MKVIRAKSAGFCWGVERAIQVAREEAQGGKRKVYTDGPLIHNRQMMELLGQEDINEVGDYESKKELDLEEDSEKESVMVIRASRSSTHYFLRKQIHTNSLGGEVGFVRPTTETLLLWACILLMKKCVYTTYQK